MRIRKKFIRKCFFLAMVFLTAGCGRTQEEAPDAEDFVYQAEFRYFYTEDNPPYLSVIGEDGTIFFACRGFGQDSHVYYLPLYAKEPAEVPLGLEEGTWVTSMGMDAEGNLLLTCSRYEEEALARLELVKISPQGEVLEKTGLTEAFQSIPRFEAECMIGDKEGICYIGCRKEIYAVDFSGKLLHKYETGAAVEDFIFHRNKDGFYLLLSDGTMAEMDGKAKNPGSAGSKKEFGYGIYDTGKEKDLLYSQGDSLYTGNIKEETHKQVLNWTDCNINANELQDFKLLKDGRILAFSGRTTGSRGECEAAFLKKVRREELPQKTTITYGCAYVNSITNTQIVRFNKTNPDFRIEIRQYGEDSDSLDTKAELLKKDIAAGTAPDILDVGLLPAEEQCILIEAGAFEDLSPYIERDGKIKREDFLENVLSVYERHGKLYAVMPTFRLEGLAGKASVIEKTSWTIQEMMDYAASLPEGDTLIAGADRKELLDILCRLNLDSFVDWESGACYFDGEEFAALLEFASGFPAEIKDMDWLAQMEQVKDGRAALIPADLIAVTDFQTYEKVFGEPANFIGYPTDTGKGTRILSCASVLAVNSASKHEEGAFAVVSYMLQENQQRELASSPIGFPIRKTALDRVLEEQMRADYEEDEQGRRVEKSKFQMQAGDFFMKFYSIKKEEADRFRELLQSAGNKMETGMEQQMLAIIAEEAEPYFEGAKELKEAAELIQNRIQIYVDESLSF